LTTAWLIALAVAVGINLLVWAVGEADQIEPMLVGGMPGVFLLVASMIAGIVAGAVEMEESRPILHHMLPVSRRTAILARVAVPVVMVIVGALLAVAMMAVSVAIFPEMPATRMTVPLFIAVQLLVAVQIPFLIGELQVAKSDGRGRTRWIVLLLVIAAIVGLFPFNASSDYWGPIRILVSGIMAVGLMVVIVVLYERRTNYTV
jgi:hypothetical protein